MTVLLPMALHIPRTPKPADAVLWICPTRKRVKHRILVEQTKKFSFEELDAYLERPSQLPLDIWFDFSDPDYIVSKLALAMITDPKHAARWRRVS